MKCQKALAPPQVIDLSDDKSDDEARSLQKTSEDVIDLINADSPAVNVHGHNRLASTHPSGPCPQPHLAPPHATQCNSRTTMPYPDKPRHHKHGTSSALPGSKTGMPSTHSSRKRAASSPDTVSLGPASYLGQLSTLVPRDMLSGAPSSSMLHPSSRPGLNTTQASSDSHHGSTATIRQHEGRRSFPSSGRTERLIDLANVTGNTRHSRAQTGLTPSDVAGGHIDLVKVTENYSGALQVASRRVRHATTDPALARALAEKAELERQLKVQVLPLGWSPHCPLALA